MNRARAFYQTYGRVVGERSFSKLGHEVAEIAQDANIAVRECQHVICEMSHSTVHAPGDDSAAVMGLRNGVLSLMRVVSNCKLDAVTTAGSGTARAFASGQQALLEEIREFAVHVGITVNLRP
jgi:hypothetical protein